MSETTVKSNDFIMPDGRKFGEVKNEQELKKSFYNGIALFTVLLLVLSGILSAILSAANYVYKVQNLVESKFNVTEVDVLFQGGTALAFNETSNSVIEVDFKIKDDEAYIVESDLVDKNFIQSITK